MRHGTSSACRRPSPTVSIGWLTRCSSGDRCWIASDTRTIGRPRSRKSPRRVRFAWSQLVGDRIGILERLLWHDPVPAIRRLVLAVLSEHFPDRIAGVFPEVLLDRAASVRDLARFVASAHQLSLVPRDVYLRSLTSTPPRAIAAAIEGVGETGSRSDADAVTPFLASPLPRHRRSALQALARLDAERAISSAISALDDDAPSVRSAAVTTLSRHASGVDFESVNRRVRSSPDPSVRRNLLKVLMNAPKWEGVVFLLEALTDSHEEVRAFAADLIDRWIDNFNRRQTQPTATQLQQIRELLDVVAPHMREETARILRFSIKT